MEFHGNLATKLQAPWNFNKVPWNFVQIQSSMEFHRTFSILPSSMEFHGTFNFPPKCSMELFWSSMELHGIPWNLMNLIFKKILFLDIVVGIWLMIRCYLAKISHYILYWFQYRNSYFEHPVSVIMAQGQRKWRAGIDTKYQLYIGFGRLIYCTHCIWHR